MFGFLKSKKKKVDRLKREYWQEIDQLNIDADDHTLDPEVRAEAIRKLDEMAGHHTRKINGCKEKK